MNQTNAQITHAKLAKYGVRVFSIAIDNEDYIVIHPDKTVEQWRKDIREIVNSLGELKDAEKDASKKLKFEFELKLIDYGYDMIDEIVSDCYEARIATSSAKIEDDPQHEEQENGFGHWGHESKNKRPK